MKSNIKRIIAGLLTACLLFCLFGCASKPADAPSASAAPEAQAPEASSSAEASESPEYPSYFIGTSVHGSGVWIIDLIRIWATSYLESVGMETTWTSCNFNSEQMINDVGNLVQSGVDGEMYMNVFGTITQSVSDKLEDGKVPWVTYCQPILEDQLEMARANPYFVGNVSPDMSTGPNTVAEAAIADGHKNAIIFTAAIGDVINDGINESIEQAFGNGGGAILEVIHCADSSEAATKADDVAAAYGDKIDMAFAANMDFAYALMNSLDNYGYEDIPIYTFSADATAVDLIAQGKIVATGVAAHDAIFAGALLINALDGHPLLDADGNAPYYTSSRNGMINADNADAYLKYYINGTPVTQADYENMLYRNNPDITYDEFIQCINNYNSVDYVIERNSGN